jgi:hypothetical protein
MEVSMRKWWKSQGVTIKGAIIGAVAALFVGCCTVFATLMGGNLEFLTSLPTETQRKKLPPSEITSFDYSEPGRIGAYSNGELYYLVTPQCWKVPSDSDDATVEGMEYPTVVLDFSVISRNEQILIDDITIILERHSNPPDLTQLTDYTIRLGHYGGGGIKFVDLGEIDIFPNHKEFHPSNRRNFTIPKTDALGFELTASFRQPGAYSLRIELVASDFWGREEKLTSETMNFNWVDIIDLEDISFRDPISGKDMKLELCR